MGTEAEVLSKLTKRVDELGKVVSNIGTKGKEAAKGMVGVATAFATGKPTISSTLDSMGGLGKNISPIAKHLEKQVGMYQQLTRGGVHFSGKMEVAGEMAISAGLDMKQFGGLIEQNTEMFAAMGNTAQDGAKNFFNQLENLRNSTDGYGQTLRALGVSYEEQAENMAMIQNFENMSMRKGFSSDAKRNAATVAFSQELDLLSKLTGKQSDELKKGMSEMMRSGDFKALQMGMGADMQAALTTGAEEAKEAGIGDLFKDMMIRGFPSKDQSKLAGLYGESMAVMQKMKAAQDEGNHAEFNRLKSQLSAATLKDQLANKELAQLGGTTGVTQIASAALAESGAFHTTLRNLYAQKTRELGRALTGDEVDELTAKARATAKKEQDKQIVEVPKQVIGVMIEAQNEMVNIAATTQKEATVRIYSEVADAMGGTLAKIKAWDPAAKLDEGINVAVDWFNDFFTNEGGPEADLAVSQASRLGPEGADLANKLQEQIDIRDNANQSSAPGDVEAAVAASTRIAELQAQIKTESTKQGITPPNTNLPPINTQVASSLQAILQELLNWTQGGPPEGQTGSPGMKQAVSELSSLTQNWGTGSLAMLHGEEAIITKKQLAMIDSSFNELFSRTASMEQPKDSNAEEIKKKFAYAMAQPKDPMADLKRLGIDPTMGAMPSTGTNVTDLQGAVNTMSAQDRQRYIMQNKDLAQLGGTTSTTSAAADALESSNSMSDLLRVMHEMKDALATGDNEGFKEMKNSLNEMTKLAQVQNRIAGKHLKVGKGMVGDLFAGGPRV